MTLNTWLYCCGDKQEATDCRKDVKCSDCGGNHVASSYPLWKRESQIMREKTEQYLSNNEASKRVVGPTATISTISYSAAVSRPAVTTASILD